MKKLWILMVCVTAFCEAEDSIERMRNEKLTPAQRNDACLELRGNRSPEIILAMRAMLAADTVRACAGENLRIAGAVEELKSALADESADVRAVAVRELGAMRRPQLIPVLAKAAGDANALAASNAVAGLAQYEEASALPYLLEAAKAGGVAGLMAFSYAASSSDARVLPVARQYLAGSDVPGQVIAMRVVANMGDASDLPHLREIAARAGTVSARGRGFGLMPAIDPAKLARTAIEEIEKRRC